MSNLLQKASIITTPTAYDSGKILSVKPVQYYGPELVTNGDFATDSDWSKLNSTISGGTGNLNGTGVTSMLYQNILTNNKTYKVTFSVSNYNGLGEARIIESSGSDIYTITSNGTFTFTFTHSNADGSFLFRARTGAIFSIDNVSVKEVLNADFDFTRNSSATRVGSNGLIQDVASNLPRIDYTGGVGSWKFEPQRTNLVTYSEDFSQSYWSKTRATITSNQIISPDGTLNADLLTATDTSENYCQQNVFSTVSGSKQTASFFVKKGTSDFCHILLWDVSNDGARQWFDLTNGFKGSSTSFGSGISVDSSQMINYGNGWYKCIVVFNNSNTTVRIRISASNYDGNTTSSVGKTIYIYGAQLEVGSYPTSYIVSNSGSATTRLADVANNAGSSDLINSTEGVLYAEFKSLSLNDTSNRRLGLTKNGTYEGLRLQLDNGTIGATVYDGTTNQYSKSVNIDNSIFHKVALKYKQSDFSLFIDGFEYLPQSSGNTFVDGTLNDLSFDYVGGNPFYTNTKCVAVFKEALTDLELECLVSWMSFSDLGINFGYTVE